MEFENNKYQPVNVFRSQTIEFRIFQSTLNPRRVLVDLEFVHSLIQFCKETSANDLSWLDWFGYFLQQPRGMYPNLRAWLSQFQSVPFSANYKDFENVPDPTKARR